MVYRDTQLFDSKLEEVCKLSKSSDYISIDESDAKMMSKNLKEKLFIDIVSMSEVCELFVELATDLNSLHLDNPVDILIRISSSEITVKDLAVLDTLIQSSSFQINCCKRAFSKDMLENSKHQLLMFLFVKQSHQNNI